MVDEGGSLPAHVEDTIRTIAAFHAEHEQQAQPIDRLFARLTRLLGRPAFTVVLTLMVLAWVGGNLMMRAHGLTPIDEPPFPWLGAAMALMAVYMTTLILSTQRRADQLAGYREQLTLQLAILGEQKNAKVIQLLQELRRDNPMMRNLVDQEAAAMAQPADPQAVLDAIKEVQRDPAAVAPPATDEPDAAKS
jgi:uncharacterized membrane protein